ncbi:MAG: cation diffusion facilitator family transporter [Planctomycetia bacterium]
MGHDHGHHGHCTGTHGHAHGLPPGRLDRAMLLGVALNATFVAVELACGIVGNSLALVADAGHNASDVLGLLLAWGATWLARRPPTARYTWGFRRTTIYAALFNAILLLVACGVILWEAWHRLSAPAPVASTTMIAVAAIGVVINTLTALLFMRGHRDANIRGAFLHMAADAAVSAGVVAAGIIILYTGLAWIDPLMSIVIALVIIASTWDLFRESVDLALDAVPRGIDPQAVATSLAEIDGVTHVRDLRIWGTSTSEASLTAHLVVPDAARHPATLTTARRLLHDRFHIDHTTIQIDAA